MRISQIEDFNKSEFEKEVSELEKKSMMKLMK